MEPRLAYPKVAPEAYKALRSVSEYFKSASIDPRLRALVELRASQINGCAYCLDLHSREARHAGETQQRLDCLPAWKETSFFDDRERAALLWTETITRVSENHVPDHIYEAVKHHFTEKELVDLTFIIAAMNAWNRLAITFRAQPPTRRAET